MERVEIEISDEMLAAGIKAIELWDSADPSDWKAISVYKAMELARRVKAAPTLAPAFPAAAEKVR